MIDQDSIAAFRFGYGLPVGPAPSQVMAKLSGPDHAAALWPGVTGAEALAAFQQLDAAVVAERLAGAAPDSPERKAIKLGLRQIRVLGRRGARAAFARAIGGDGLRERLVRFWADHFTTTPRALRQRAWPPSMVEDAIRPNLAGPFATMLQAVASHPAMLIYLDQTRSVGPTSKRGKKSGKGLNENYARELLELHTLGVGAEYSQDDVRQLAKLLTGLAFSEKTGGSFDGARAEPGAETVLGIRYQGKGLEPIHRLLENLAQDPRTAQHIAGKLAVHFVADEPDPALVAQLAQVWRQTGGDLAAVSQCLIEAPQSWRPDTGKARQPFDFIVAALRAMGVTADQLYQLPDGDFDRQILLPIAAMGQPWYDVPGPDGWPEEAQAWITPAGLAARIDWAIAIPEALLPQLPDPRAFAEAALGPRLGARLAWAVAASESRREGLGLVLASPEFNRR